jgi:hypothetical protein
MFAGGDRMANGPRARVLVERAIVINTIKKRHRVVG